MIKNLIILLSIIFVSCSSSQEIISYEYTQKKKIAAHLENTQSVSIILETGNRFTLQIIKDDYYGYNPIVDTFLITGTYVKNKKGYELTDLNDKKVNFRLRRYNNKVWLKGIYFNKRNSEYESIQNKSLF